MLITQFALFIYSFIHLFIMRNPCYNPLNKLTSLGLFVASKVMNIYLHADNEIDKPQSFAQDSSMQGYGALWNLGVYGEKQPF